MMTSLLESASTDLVYLITAGVIMVAALTTSKKAHTVLKTSIDLSSKNEGDEMFGSSRTARSMVRWSNSIGHAVVKIVPEKVLHYIDRRFAAPEIEDNTVAYDLLRASVNLVVASLLIALGTSFKLPLSTTFVTFMVAMGTSLADRAWTRESAVFRITGVITVIGGWFITAGVAFSAGFLVSGAMFYGGWAVVFSLAAIGMYTLFKSHVGNNSKEKEMQEGDILFQEMLKLNDRTEIVPMLKRHIGVCTAELVISFADCLRESTDGLFTENLRTLRKTNNIISLKKREVKNLRRRENICLRKTEPAVAIHLSTDFHLVHNSLRQIRYGLLPAGRRTSGTGHPGGKEPPGSQSRRFPGRRGLRVLRSEFRRAARLHQGADQSLPGKRNPGPQGRCRAAGPGLFRAGSADSDPPAHGSRCGF
jgi:hypothetical protein